MLLTKARLNLHHANTILVLFDALDRVAGYLTLASVGPLDRKNTLANGSVDVHLQMMASR